MTIYNITGLGPVVVNSYVTSPTGYDPNHPTSTPLLTYEYTSGQLTNNYQQDMEVLQTIFNKKSGLTAADYTNLYNAAFSLDPHNNPPSLWSLAQNGVNNDPFLSQGTYYMTAQMAYYLGPIMQSLQIVGINPDNSSPTNGAALIQAWQSLGGTGIAGAITGALQSTVGGANSLQSMLELDYVKAGNDYIGINLGNLEAALSTSQTILNNLTVVQNVLNEITVTTKGNFKFPPDNSSQIPSTAINNLKSIGIPNGSFPATITAANIQAIGNLRSDVASNIQNSPNSNVAVYVLNLLEGYLFSGVTPTADQTAVFNYLSNNASANASSTFFDVANNGGSVSNQVLTSSDILGIYNALSASGQSGLASAMNIDYHAIPSNPATFANATISGTFASAFAADVANAQAYAAANNISFNDAFARQSSAAALLRSYANGNTEQFVKAYQIAASAQFTQIFPTATPTANAASSLMTAYAALKTDIHNLATQSGQSASTTNSLAYFINNVASDISAYMNNPVYATKLSAVTAFIIDNQNKQLSTAQGFKAGTIQTDVTNAISSAQNLNNQQQVQVTNYEFIFQSFYTSAGDALSQINQILSGIAQKIDKQ